MEYTGKLVFLSLSSGKTLPSILRILWHRISNIGICCTLIQWVIHMYLN